MMQCPHVKKGQGLEKANREPDIYVYIFSDMGKFVGGCTRRETLISIISWRCFLNKKIQLSIYVALGNSREDLPEGNLLMILSSVYILSLLFLLYSIPI